MSIPRNRHRPRRWPVLAGALLGAAVIILALVLVQTRRPLPPPRFTLPADCPARHVIMVSFDTTRPDHFGCYGNVWIRTPCVDGLAGESIVLTDFMTVANTTLPSHISLMTGKYPHTHGVPRNGFVLHDDNLMLAEILQSAGFRTAAFLGSFAIDERFNFDQGFEHFDAQFDMFVGPGRVDQNQRRAAAVTDAVIAYLDDAGVPDYLFLFVHYFDPHMPYDPPPPYDRMYGPHAGGISIEDHPALTSGVWADADLERLRGYAGEVSYLDEHFGRLLDDLRQRGVLDEALLILTSDHGETMRADAQHQFDHGWYATQEELHAIGVVRLPHGEHGGTRLNAPLCSIDLLPTILAYLGLPTLGDVEGVALGLGPDGELPASSRIRFAEASKPWYAEQGWGWFNNDKARCVRQGSFKYIRTAYQEGETLYDLMADPAERLNLLAAGTPTARARANAMREELESWTATQDPLPTHFERERYRETIRKLGSLGYLEDWDVDESDLAPPGGEQ